MSFTAERSDEKASQKLETEHSATPDISKNDNELQIVSSDQQPDTTNVTTTKAGGLTGVEIVQATTRVWTKPWLITAFVFIWLVYFVDSLQQQASSSLTPYVTSSFGKHGLVATTSIVSTIVAGVSKLPLSRVLDIFGRNSGLIVSLVITVIALILMAACANVETYAAAQVFFWTGMNNIAYVLSIFIYDTTKVKRSMTFQGIALTPYVPNTFTGPLVAQAFLNGPGWRWGYGAFCIIIPVVCAPLIFILWFNTRKAKRRGLVQERKSELPAGTPWYSKVWYYFLDLDCPGILLMVAGFSLVLLAISLAGYQGDKWRSASVISMLVVGVLCLIAFPFYEKFLARKTFIRYELFQNRNLLSACLLGANTWISFYCYKLYFSSYLQVVYNLSVSQSGYIGNIYNVVTCVWAPLVGELMHWIDGFKILGVIGVPLWILFTGLMIHFRTPGTNVGLVIMCEVFTSLAGGTLTQVGACAVQSSVDRADIAVAVALVALTTSVGGAVGQTISGAIWTNTLPGKLRHYLPDEYKNQTMAIYGDLTTQLGFEWDSAPRRAIVQAYGETQKLMLIASVATSVGSLVWVAIMKDQSLKKRSEETDGARVLL